MQLKIKTGKGFLATVLLGGIFVVGIFFRVYQFNDVPKYLNWDAAYYAADAIHLARNLQFQVFFPGNGGREGLFMNLLAGAFTLFGTEIDVIKILVLTINIATVVSFYFLLKTLFPKSHKAVIPLGLLLFVSSSWLLSINRMLYRVNLLPLFEILTLVSVFKMLEKLNAKRALLAGALFGLGFYTFTSFKVNGLVIAAFATLSIVGKYLKTKQVKLKPWLLYFATASLVALPIIIFATTHYAEFMYRVNEVSVFAGYHEHPYRVIVLNILRYLRLTFLEGLLVNPIEQIIFDAASILGVVMLVKGIRRREFNNFLEVTVLTGFLAYCGLMILLYNFYMQQTYFESLELLGVLVYKLILEIYLLNWVLSLEKIEPVIKKLTIICFIAAIIVEITRTGYFFIGYQYDAGVILAEGQNLTADYILSQTGNYDKVLYFDYGDFKRFNLAFDPILEFKRLTGNNADNITYVKKEVWETGIPDWGCEKIKCLAVLPHFDETDINDQIISSLISKYGGKEDLEIIEPGVILVTWQSIGS